MHRERLRRGKKQAGVAGALEIRGRKGTEISVDLQAGIRSLRALGEAELYLSEMGSN